MLLVLDTTVIVSAFRSRRGASNRLLRLAVEGRIRPLVTTALFLEYEAVLKRPEQRLETGSSLADIDRILAALASLLEPVEIHFRWRPQLADPGDEMVLEAAINGRAEAIVTFDRRGFAGMGDRFRVEVLRPADIVRRLAT